jgi:hypothetical protein
VYQNATRELRGEATTFPDSTEFNSMSWILRGDEAYLLGVHGQFAHSGGKLAILWPASMREAKLVDTDVSASLSFPLVRNTPRQLNGQATVASKTIDTTNEFDYHLRALMERLFRWKVVSGK